MNGARSALPAAHVAEFYRSESVLHESIANFFADALVNGDQGVMIARPHTFDAVTRRLGAASRRSTAEVAKQLMFVDVSAALEQFMDGDSVDPGRVEQGFSSLLSTVRGRRATGTIRIYGEAVDVLCRRHNHDAAITVEQIWNGRFAGPDVSVLCGYSIASFDDDVHARMLRRVCREHTQVVQSDGVRPSRRFGADAPATIYIVDDDPSVRRSLQRLLALNGWDVRTYPSAEAFLGDVAALSPGCLVLDVGLGGMSGLDLQRWMAHVKWPMPVVAISGAHDPQVEVQALRLGATAFLPKPFESRALVDAIALALSPRIH